MLFTTLLASSDHAAEAAGIVGVVAAILGFMLCCFGVILAVAIILLSFIYKAAKTVPQDHRQMEPGHVWFMLIPIFNLFWAFKVIPAVSGGLKSARTALFSSDDSDCGLKIGTIFCWMNVVQMGVYIVLLITQQEDGTFAEGANVMNVVHGLLVMVTFALYLAYVVTVHKAAKGLTEELQP